MQNYLPHAKALGNQVHVHVHVRDILYFQYNGKEILWKHVQDLYHHDSGARKSVGGLSLVPKLKYEHVYLTSFSVDLATQGSYKCYA